MIENNYFPAAERVFSPRRGAEHLQPKYWQLLSRLRDLLHRWTASREAPFVGKRSLWAAKA
jgi:hypothetical protein